MRTERDRSIDAKMEELKEALSATPIDDGRVKKLTKDLAKLQVEAFQDKVQVIANTRKTLSPEQLERVRSIVASRRE